jgi:hypothetical protein
MFKWRALNFWKIQNDLRPRSRSFAYLTCADLFLANDSLERNLDNFERVNQSWANA